MALRRREATASKFATGFFNRYNITTTKLGEGSFATVLLGFDRISRTQVAVKTIDRSKLQERDEKKLHDEVVILKSLRHPHVVKVMECYVEENKFYMVMEIVKGGTLKDKMAEAENYLSEDCVKSYTRELIEALQYCKDRGVIHRDVKAENILIDSNNRVKLADFNLAKQIDPSHVEFSIIETMCGTPNYVAPEILAGKSYDYKCDVWSVGVAAFFMLSNSLPFTVDTEDAGETLTDLLKKVSDGRWNFVPEERWTDVSINGRDFVYRCLQKDPNKRYDYAQLLGHKWLKRPQGERLIDTSSALPTETKRKLLSTAFVVKAANEFHKHMQQQEKPQQDFSNEGYGDSMAVFNTSLGFLG